MAQKRYYRSQLSTIVWDAENDCILADFSAGHFTTSDKRVQGKLEEFGYPEIPLNATEPPAIVIQQPTYAIQGDVPVMSKGVAPIVAQKKMESITHEEGGPEKPAEKKTTAKPKTKKPAPKKKPAAKKTSSKAKSEGAPKLKRLKTKTKIK
jgi:hypothetical protein